MKICGVIAEFNPFHKGHQYLLDTIKQEQQADAVIVVMSGDFVQRGAPAITDKFTRTRMALEAGADIVLEMPVRFAISSAESFARSGVATLQHTGVVDTISFGMEHLCDHQDMLSLCQFLLDEPKVYKESLQQYLKNGLSFPAARQRAIEECAPELNTALLATPNNILGLEYQKALLHFQSSITVEPILRKGTVSAHAIRKQMLENQEKGMYTDDFSTSFQYQLWNYTHKQSNISSLPHHPVPPKDVEFSDELFQRLLNSLDYTDTLTDCIFKCKTKQYTHSRISRCMFRFLLGLTTPTRSASSTDYAPYLRVLGFRTASSWVLKEMRSKAKVPILQKLTDDQCQLQGLSSQMLFEDLSAHECYRMHALQKNPNDTILDDYTQGIICIK